MANKICTGMGVVIDKDKLSMMMDTKEFTNARLATIIGVDKSTVSNWKAGKSKVNKKSFEQMLAVFECKESDLLPNVIEEISEKSEVKKETSKEAKTDISGDVSALVEIVKSQNENIAVLCSALNTAIDALNDISKRDTAALAEITIEAVNSDFRSWKADIMRFANKVVSMNKSYKTTNAVLSEAYTLLRNQYGVVWEQEKREFFEVNQRQPVSTLELQFWIETTKPTYKNLLVAKLDTLCHKDERKVV